MEQTKRIERDSKLICILIDDGLDWKEVEASSPASVDLNKTTKTEPATEEEEEEELNAVAHSSQFNGGSSSRSSSTVPGNLICILTPLAP